MTETLKSSEEPPVMYDVNGAFHPNRIGAWGVAAQTTGFAVEASIGTSNAAALIGMAAGGISDLADGHVARKWPEKLKTLEGAKLDPLLDKVKTYLTALYIAAQGANAPVMASYAFNALVDYISTAQRGPVTDQLKEAVRAIINPASCTVDAETKSSTRANWAGKGKTLLQNTTGIALVGENLIREKALPVLGLEVDSTLYQNINAVGLSVAAALGAYGVYKKGQAKKQV
jgi:phosphatidylglycerophosphate synthase